jgi:3-methyladenine DNA glycosylase Mpg
VVPDAEVSVGPRIGIHRDRAADWPQRYWLAGSPWVSKRS